MGRKRTCQIREYSGATKLLTLTAVALVMGSVAPALAQNADNQAQGADTQVDVIPDYAVGLDEWGYEGLYEEGSWTAEQVLDAEVYGPTDEEIGEVENIVVGTGGTIEALIIEVGGFWDIGDTHARVPWSEVEVGFENGDANVQVPVTEETIEDYDVFGGIAGEFRVVDDDDPFTPRGWRVTELINDYATLEGGVRYGWVEDLVFDQAGRLEAVVVDANYGAYGPYAYPYYGYGHGFRPGYPYYELPYGEAEIGELEPFDYDRFEGIED